MKKFIVEAEYDVLGFETENEAVKYADVVWNHMTEREQLKAEYFKVYEISVDIDETVNDVADYMTRMIKNYLER